MKKMNNKGFSLVELIIVIAIMAVLMGVLAPQFLKYVESSRVQKDESALSEVENAVKIACSLDSVYGDLKETTTVTIKGDGSVPASGITALDDELAITVPDGVEFSSKKYQGLGEQEVKVEIDGTTGVVKVTNSWSTATP